MRIRIAHGDGPALRRHFLQGHPFPFFKKRGRHMFKFNFIRFAVTILFGAIGCGLGADTAFAQAQATTGQITGIVRDNAGAAIPSATIKVTNTQTGLSQTATSSDDGLYRFVLLPPGVYNLTAEAANFTKTEQKDILVTVGQITDLNITLGVGAVSEAVT